MYRELTDNGPTMDRQCIDIGSTIHRGLKGERIETVQNSALVGLCDLTVCVQSAKEVRNAKIRE